MNNILTDSFKSNSKREISITEKDGKYFFRLPYILKDLFRTVFKSAAWNAFDKAFVVKANTANKNKWQRFIEAADTLSSDIAAAADAELTAENLQALLDKAESMRAELQRKVNDCKAKEHAFHKEIAESKKVALLLSPIAESAAVAAAEALAMANAVKNELRSAAAPALNIFRANGVEDIFSTMVRAAHRGYLGKNDLTDAQEALKTIHRQLYAAGYEHKLIRSICGLSLNRPDKFLNDIPRAQEHLLTGLEPAR